MDSNKELLEEIKLIRSRLGWIIFWLVLLWLCLGVTYK